jgi:hypothetical protein
MDSNLNIRHAELHSAELHRRAELHRITATARAMKRGARPTRQSQLHLGGLTEAVRATAARLSTAVRGNPVVGSKTHRA